MAKNQNQNDIDQEIKIAQELRDALFRCLMNFVRKKGRASRDGGIPPQSAFWAVSELLADLAVMYGMPAKDLKAILQMQMTRVGEQMKDWKKSSSELKTTRLC